MQNAKSAIELHHTLKQRQLMHNGNDVPRRSCVHEVKWWLIGTGYSSLVRRNVASSPYRVRLQYKQAIPIFWQFLGRSNRPKVCHTSKSQRFPVISDETNYCRLVFHNLINAFPNLFLYTVNFTWKKTTSGKFRPHSAGPVCIAHPAHPITTPLRTNH